MFYNVYIMSQFLNRLLVYKLDYHYFPFAVVFTIVSSVACRFVLRL